MQAPGQVQRGSEESSEGSGEGLGGFGAEPGQVQQGSGEGSGEGLIILEHAEVFPALGFAARFRKICKYRTLRLLGIPPKLIFQ